MTEIEHTEFFNRFNQAVEQAGVIVTQRQHGLMFLDEDIVLPHLVIVLCHEGSARVLYDMVEKTFVKNDLAFIMPEHVLHQIECSDDFVFTRVVVSGKMLAELRSNLFITDHDKFVKDPILNLNDEQVDLILSAGRLLSAIAAYSEDELPMRHLSIQAQLAIGFDLLNIYFHKQNSAKPDKRSTGIFFRFRKLVIEHYLESREVQFYADQLNYTPKHLTKLIRQESGGLAPSDWIEQYVVVQAKRHISLNPTKSLHEIASMIGFSDPTAFYRYFKRVTGITAREYRVSIKAKKQK